MSIEINASYGIFWYMNHLYHADCMTFKGKRKKVRFSIIRATCTPLVDFQAISQILGLQVWYDDCSLGALRLLGAHHRK